MAPQLDEDSRGLKRLLQVPDFYLWFQNAIYRRPIVPDLLDEIATTLGKNPSVLDIGCGPGSFLRLQGDNQDHQRYLGIDPSEDYIRKARRDFPNATFYCGTVSQIPENRRKFDLVLLSGVLHHVSDAGVAEIISFASSRLNPSGKIVTVDPVIFPGQNWLARSLALLDRGKHVRSPDELVLLWKEQAPAMEVVTRIKSGYLRLVSYNHVVCVAQNLPLR